MQHHLTFRIGVAILLGIIFSAASYPIEDSPSTVALDLVGPRNLLSRVPAAFPVPPGLKPGPKKPEKPAGLQGSPVVPGGSGPPYEPATEYGNYLIKGKTYQQTFDNRRITDPDNDHNYAKDIENYRGYDKHQLALPDIEVFPFKDAPPINFKLDGGWKKYETTTKDQKEAAAKFFHSPDQQTTVLSELYNQRLGKEFDVNAPKIPWSELLFQTYSKEAGPRTSELKYLVYASVSPLRLREVIDAARKLKDLEKFNTGGWVSFAKNADSRSDRDAFTALTGLETTKTAFSMVTDHKIAFSGKQPSIVHTYSEGLIGGSARHIVIELG